jgi:hypothetical protein
MSRATLAALAISSKKMRAEILETDHPFKAEIDRILVAMRDFGWGSNGSIESFEVAIQILAEKTAGEHPDKITRRIDSNEARIKVLEDALKAMEVET